MTHPSDIDELSERLRGGYAHKRPFPFKRIDRGRVVVPIYAIHDDDLREFLSEIDALQARVKELEQETFGNELLKNTYRNECAMAVNRALRAEQQRDEAVERCAKVAESFAPATQDMMSTTISDYCDSIAAAIRQLAATSDPKETTNG